MAVNIGGVVSKAIMAILAVLDKIQVAIALLVISPPRATCISLSWLLLGCSA